MRGYGPDSYGEAFADVYDEWYATVSDVAATVAGLARLAGDGPVLELGVGTGRLALPLAATGLEVHGVDTSEAMLARLAAKPGADRLRLTLGDMAADLPAGPFTLAFAAYNTLFNLPTADTQAACFRAVAERLQPGGRFVVEAFVPGEPPAESSVEVRDLAVDRVVLSVACYDGPAQVAEGQLVELTSAGVRLRPWSIRWATPEQLDLMAGAAGLALESRWPSWTDTWWSPEADHHVSVYRRHPETVAPA